MVKNYIESLVKPGESQILTSGSGRAALWVPPPDGVGKQGARVLRLMDKLSCFAFIDDFSFAFSLIWGGKHRFLF